MLVQGGSKVMIGEHQDLRCVKGGEHMAKGTGMRKEKKKPKKKK
jgi:hypothetical protein